jgi:uncharacterized protein (TIGR02598 family)
VRTKRGFSLVEVTLAIGIIAFALLAIVALIPVGVKSGGEAIDATRTSLAAKDAQNRVKSSVTSTIFASATDAVLPTWYYDREGIFLGTAVSSNAFYRVDATIHKDWGGNASPPNVDATVLRPTTLQLRWPLDTSNGAALGNNNASFTFYVRRP